MKKDIWKILDTIDEETTEPVITRLGKSKGRFSLVENISRSFSTREEDIIEHGFIEFVPVDDTKVEKLIPTPDEVLKSEKSGFYQQHIEFSERGGIITFSGEVNAVRLHKNKLLNLVAQKVLTFRQGKQKYQARVITNTLQDTLPSSKKSMGIGYTLGKQFKGVYVSASGEVFNEKSLTLEIIGLNSAELEALAIDLCKNFYQQSVLVKDYSSGEIYFVGPVGKTEQQNP